jgi:hypothetical protein
LHFGVMSDGQAYRSVVRDIVSTLLSWKLRANVTVTLRPDNVEVACRAKLPEGEIPFTDERRRPFFVFGDGLAFFGRGWLGSPHLQTGSFACRQALWELRDGYGEQSVLYDEGVCLKAGFSAPDLPEHLCLRVTFSIGTERLPFTHATIEQIAKSVRYMGGPAEATYWGCVTIWDKRTNESRVVVVTDPPPRPFGHPYSISE